MRRLYYLVLFLLSAAVSEAQHASMNAALKMKLLDRQLSQEIQTVLVKGNIASLLGGQDHFNYTVNYSSGDIASVSCRLNVISALMDQKIIRYAEWIPAHLKPLSDTMIVRNRIKPVKLGSSPLTQPYNGEGVLMGLIDTGIDFNHPDFKDSLGHTRVKYLWDQVPASGSSVPQPYNYGIEWTEAQINAQQCTHSDVSNYGHGTGVSGIAAGNGLGNGHHQGSASKSDIIMVALDFSKSGPTVADAVDYIFSKANSLGKPCVINASLGDYYGSHDATDLQTKMIESQLQNIPGRAMVAAAGNAGGIKFHVKTETQSTDTVFTWIRNTSPSLDYWLYADTADIKNMKIRVGANRSNYADLGAISFATYTYGLTNVQTDTLFHNGDRIGIIKNSSSINSDGVYELYLQIEADTANLLWRIESAGAGLHHAWNFDLVSSPLPTVAQYSPIAHYVSPDTMLTMVSGFQCSEEITTVGAFHNMRRYYDVFGTLHDNGIDPGTFSPFSSQGPTRDGRQKPDITASGAIIFAPLIMSIQSLYVANVGTTVAQGTMHVLSGGTSAASPVVAGLAALYLQKHPLATSADVRAAIIACAYKDQYTGFNLPDPVWGHGKLDGLATMTCGENIVGISSISGMDPAEAYPNPFHDKTLLKFASKDQRKIQVFSVDGKLLQEQTVRSDRYELELKDPDYKGLLIVKVSGDKEAYSFKLIRD